MKVLDFTGCCTAKVIVGLGQTFTAEYEGKDDISVEDLTHALTYEVKRAKLRGMAIVTATTNNEQKTANKALKLAGFKWTPWCSKTQHRETRVRLWFKPTQEVS